MDGRRGRIVESVLTAALTALATGVVEIALDRFKRRRKKKKKRDAAPGGPG